MYAQVTKEEIKRYWDPNFAHGTIEDIFGSEESRVTIEGKYQHMFMLDDSIEKIVNMKWL